MRIIHFILLLSVLSEARNWMGLRPPAPKKDTSHAVIAPGAAPAASVAVSDQGNISVTPKADSVFIDRQVLTLPADVQGNYVGNLEEVQCFNCESNVVSFFIGDSVTTRKFLWKIRDVVWNAIERPIKDKRVFEYNNRCFYFGFNPVDTVYVAGERVAVKTTEISCYPYLQRNDVGRVSEMQEREP